MARRRRRKSESYNTHKTHHPNTLMRDHLVSLTPPALHRPSAFALEDLGPRPYAAVDWLPQWDPPPRREWSRWSVTPSPSPTPPRPRPQQMAEQGPADVFRAVLCARRGIRRQVLHAFGKAGKRGRKGRYRRNLFSGVHC